MLYSSILDAIGNTPMVELRRLQPRPSVQLFAKLEGQNPTGSLKDRIVKNMLEAAETAGLLSPGATILEPTSGNTGVSLAMIAYYKGYRVKVIMPDNVTDERRQLLEAYGAEIVWSDGEKGTNGAIELAQEILAAEPDRYFMPYQYGNEANPRAHYESTGVEIINDLPDVDVFIAGLGTAGTLMGVGRRLKEHNPAVRVIAVVPHPEERIQGLRSLEEGFIPPILDPNLLDGQFIVTSLESFRMARALMETEGIFAGISSGAVIACALRVAERMETGKIVCLLADGGWKYLSTGLWNRPLEELEGEIGRKIWW